MRHSQYSFGRYIQHIKIFALNAEALQKKKLSHAKFLAAVGFCHENSVCPTVGQVVKFANTNHNELVESFPNLMSTPGPRNKDWAFELMEAVVCTFEVDKSSSSEF